MFLCRYWVPVELPEDEDGKIRGEDGEGLYLKYLVHTLYASNIAKWFTCFPPYQLCATRLIAAKLKVAILC